MAQSGTSIHAKTEQTGLPIPPLKTLRLEKASVGVTTADDEEDGQPLSPVSQLFHKPDSNSYILAIFGFKTLVDVDHFREQMVGFARGHRRFHSLQVGDKKKQKLRWVRTEVDICKHVIAPEIDPPEMISSGEKFLEDYLHNLSKTEIDMSKPLWEFHILNGVETSSDVKSIGIGRIHHSLGDGTSLMLYFLTFARKSSTGAALTAATLIPVARKPSSEDEQKKSLQRRMKRFWTLARNTTVDVLSTLATTSFLKDSKNPVSAPPDTGRAPRRIVQRTVSLDDIKLITKATNTKVNDILMAVLEAGLSRYLNRKYGEISKCKGQKSNVAPDIRLRTLVTFNLRMTQPISQIGSVKKSGNQVGFIIYPLQVPTRSSPMEYIRAAKAKMDRKKASLEAHFTNLFTRVIVKLFGTKLLELPKNLSLYYSNMIGPLEDITWFGYAVEHMAISCYGSPIGLYVNVTSYGNKLTFAVSVDERAVPDPIQLCDDFEDSLGLMKKAAAAAAT